MEEIRFDAVARMGTSTRTHENDRGEVSMYRRVRRHYTPDEAERLFAAADLALCRAWCAYDHRLPYGSRPEGMVLLAKKARA